MAKKKKKVRVDLRKNRSKPPRPRQWTRGFHEHGFTDEATAFEERVRAKGDLSRRRTIIQEEGAEQTSGEEHTEMPAVDQAACLRGRVIRVQGLFSIVQTEEGESFRCVVRRVLRTLATDERNIVTTGDHVWFLPAVAGQVGEERQGDEETPTEKPLREGVIERVEPRHGVLTRSSRKREHVLVANVDQVVFVLSLVEPDLKPHLIDRYLASAEQGGIRPILCLNKVDRVDPEDYLPLVGLYSQLGITTLLTSATTGVGIEPLRSLLHHRETVFSGQSGVGKSSLLNAIQPGLGLQVNEVSEVNQKGRHTTTTAELIALDFGGWVVDTPGIRQFSLYDVIPEEVEGFFPEFRPYVSLCGFPDCTHTHEDRCAVKRAVRLRQISGQRYTSYLGMFNGTEP
jgi:ribosome biogenesis GTPase